MSGARDCLAGLRVIELAQYLPGPFAGQLLSDLGAEVVKIEPPSGDPLRAFGPLDADGLAVTYKLINAGKTTVALDLKDAADQARAQALVAAGDVLLESYRPGTLDRLGLGQEHLKALNPSLVHCSLSGYGQTGPYAQRSGHDINYMALGGGLALSGLAERPIPAFPPTADFASALQATLAIVAALLRRERTGEGARIDVALSEAVLAWQAPGLTAALLGEAARGQGLLNGGVAGYQVYRTADDRFLSLGALEAKFWTNFCRALERPDWIDRLQDPLPQRDLIAELQAAFMAEPLDHWQALLEEVDCAFMPVKEPQELLRDPQVAARGLLRQEDAGLSVLFAALFDGQPPAVRPPLIESDATALLARWQEPA